MRILSDGLKAKLERGVTTFCRCWRIERKDGVVMGFTDHDADLTVDSVLYEADSGFTAGEIEHSLGLSVDNVEVSGALRSQRIAEADVARGVYDAARVTQFLVDWTDTAERIVLFAGVFGEIRRGATAFEVEFNGLSEALNRPIGRAYLRKCGAVLGDERCGVDLDQAAFKGTGAVVSALGDRRFSVSGLDDFAADWFSLGRLVWSGGGNGGQSAAVRSFKFIGGDAVVELWRAPASPPEAEDAFDIHAGCDKRADTCRAKFSNFENFRGFPHIPGDDWMNTYPNSDEVHDGGSLFR